MDRVIDNSMSYQCPVVGCLHSYKRRSDLKVHVLKKHFDFPANLVSPPRSRKVGKKYPCPCGYSRKLHLQQKHENSELQPIYILSIRSRLLAFIPIGMKIRHLEDRASPPVLVDDFDLFCSFDHLNLGLGDLLFNLRKLRSLFLDETSDHLVEIPKFSQLLGQFSNLLLLLIGEQFIAHRLFILRIFF